MQNLSESSNLSPAQTKYWDEYYKNGLAPPSPSDFAKFAFNYMQCNKKLIDLGCGNGRDSLYFGSQGLKVTAIDASKSAIDSFDKTAPIFAVCDDFVKTKALCCIDYDYCYARWSIHAINQHQQDELLPNIYNSLNNGGSLFIEARTINDSKYGKGICISPNEYYFDNHYRRFLDPDIIKNQISDLGFDIVYFEESNSFSVLNNDNPTLIRVVATKC